jgi:hypothetical protein
MFEALKGLKPLYNSFFKATDALQGQQNRAAEAVAKMAEGHPSTSLMEEQAAVARSSQANAVIGNVVNGEKNALLAIGEGSKAVKPANPQLMEQAEKARENLVNQLGRNLSAARIAQSIE